MVLDTGALAEAGVHSLVWEVVVYILVWLAELACKQAWLVEVVDRLVFEEEAMAHRPVPILVVVGKYELEGVRHI